MFKALFFMHVVFNIEEGENIFKGKRSLKLWVRQEKLHKGAET